MSLSRVEQHRVYMRRWRYRRADQRYWDPTYAGDEKVLQDMCRWANDPDWCGPEFLVRSSMNPSVAFAREPNSPIMARRFWNLRRPRCDRFSDKIYEA